VEAGLTKNFVEVETGFPIKLMLCIAPNFPPQIVAPNCLRRIVLGRMQLNVMKVLATPEPGLSRGYLTVR